MSPEYGQPHPVGWDLRLRKEEGTGGQVTTLLSDRGCSRTSRLPCLLPQESCVSSTATGMGYAYTVSRNKPFFSEVLWSGILSQPQGK